MGHDGCCQSGSIHSGHETGAELRHLTGAMNEIHNTLSGSLVSTHSILI